MDAKEILTRPYARKLTPQDGGGFVATIQEFPGCIADGRTAEEALSNLEDAATSWIDAMRDQGGAIPEPVNYHGYSGKIALRIPRGLHKQAAEMALSEGTSVNQFLTGAIAHYLGGRQALTQFITHFTTTNNHLTLNIVFPHRAATLGNMQQPAFFPLAKIAASGVMNNG